MAGVTLDQLPPVTSLGGQEIFWIYQPTGNLTTPWVGYRCTLQQVASYRQGVYTVSTLPTPYDGLASFVTDSTLPASGNFGAALTGGGTNHVPVYYDGGAAAWLIG